jgi:glycosyltransferase involved in cell wall biosynthesis
MTMDRCVGCPAPEGLVCPSVNHAHYCVLANREGKNRAYWREFLRTGAAPEPAPPSRGGIVQLWPGCIVGGAEWVMLSIRKALPDLPWRGIALAGNYEDAGFRATLESYGPVAFGRDDAKALIARADVVLAWSMSNFPDWLAGVDPPPRVILVSHSTDDSAWAKCIFDDDRLVTGYVAVSESALGVIPERRRRDAVIIPNAVDLDRLAVAEGREAVRASWGVEPGQKVLGCLNRISTEKDPAMLPRTVAALPSDWVGVMVGEGPERGRAEAEAERCCPGRCRFPGQRLDVGSVLNAFDAFLCTSLYESFGLSLAEALTVGIPVVSTPVGIVLQRPDLARVVPHGSDGAVFALAVLADRADAEGTARRTASGKREAARLWGITPFAAAWREVLAPPGSYPGVSGAGRTEKRYMSGFPWGDRCPKMGTTDYLRLSEQARSCVFRGCRTSCTRFACRRYGVDVGHAECTACCFAGGGAPRILVGPAQGVPAVLEEVSDG